ncbi:MAG: serine/threonine-protein kinase [Planctomycetota bacterium]
MSGAGVALGSSDYRIEADAYLQRRLVIIYGFVLGASLLFLALDVLSSWLASGDEREYPEYAGRLIHVIGSIALAVHYSFLRRRRYSESALRYFDAFLVLGTIATCLGIYVNAIGHEGAYRLIWIASLLVVGRGITVPSSVRWTFLLSLFGPLALLIVRLGRPIDPGHGLSQLSWDVTVMGLAVALSTLASRINFRLREEAAVARKLGQYQLEEKLGEGAMGTVYRATHHMLRRPTAVKLLRPELAGEETVARFEREVRQTALLQHPNTINIYDYGRTPDGIFYYAMELLDGADLAHIVKTSGPLPPARVIHVLRQVCASLNEAHAAGLVHRDVKLGNIVLCRRAGLHDIAKVLDFGLVKDLRDEGVSLTQVGMLCGTPETIAPELLLGESATARSDLYAVGIVGCQLLTGELPFDAPTAGALIAAHMSDEPRIPEGELGALLGRCLAKSPEQRPASAVELRDLLGPSDWTEADAAAWWQSYRAP